MEASTLAAVLFGLGISGPLTGAGIGEIKKLNRLIGIHQVDAALEMAHWIADPDYVFGLFDWLHTRVEIACAVCDDRYRFCVFVQARIAARRATTSSMIDSGTVSTCLPFRAARSRTRG